MARSKIYAYEAQAAKGSEEAAQLKQAEASDTANLRQSQQRERERAEQLVRDLAKAARIVLERAVGMGGAQASFALAETYDPLILPNLGTYGTQGDLAKARTLYARAEAGGSKEAKA